MTYAYAYACGSNCSITRISFLAALFFIVYRGSESTICVYAFEPPHRPSIRWEWQLHRGRFENNDNNLDEKLVIPSDISSSCRMIRLLRGNRRRRQRQRGFIYHQESHVTAAGVESLFCLSWWRPFSYERATTAAQTESHNELRCVVESSVGFTSIDCGWACVSNTEKIQLQQMKHLLRSELKMIADNNLHERYPDVYSDLRLMRFLRKSKERDADCGRLFSNELGEREETRVGK